MGTKKKIQTGVRFMNARSAYPSEMVAKYRVDAVFTVLDAMTRTEQKEIAERLLSWIHENGLAP